MAALDLTDEQKKTMQDLKAEHQKAMVDLRATYQKARIDLSAVRNEDNPMASDIQAKIDALMAAQGKMMARGIQHDMEVRNVLTPEQREKLGETHSYARGPQRVPRARRASVQRPRRPLVQRSRWLQGTRAARRASRPLKKTI